MAQVFRVKKSWQYLGLACSAFFLAACAWSCSLFFLEHPAEHGFQGEHSVAVGGGMGLVVFGTMLLVSIYLWIAARVEHVTLDGSVVSIRSVFQQGRFDASEIERLKWSPYPAGGKVVFLVQNAKFRVDLGGYRPDDRLQMIRGLHDLVPIARQEQWPLFCQRVALPLRDGQPWPAHETYAIETGLNRTKITRQRYDRWAAWGVPLSLLAATMLWYWVREPGILAFPVTIVGAWLLLRFHTPRQGMFEESVTATVQGRAAVKMSASMPTTMLLLILLPLVGIDPSVAIWIGAASFIAVNLPLLFVLLKEARERDRNLAPLADLAAERWQQGTPSKTSG